MFLRGWELGCFVSSYAVFLDDVVLGFSVFCIVDAFGCFFLFRPCGIGVNSVL